MKHYKKILIFLIVLSVISFIAGYVIIFPDNVGLCSPDDKACIRSYPDYSWGEPLSIVPIFPLLIFIILLFTPASFFRAWRWFALAFGLISIVLIIYAPAQGGGIMSIDKEIISLTMGILFSIISLLIILFQTFVYFQKKKRKK